MTRYWLFIGLVAGSMALFASAPAWAGNMYGGGDNMYNREEHKAPPVKINVNPVVHTTVTGSKQYQTQVGGTQSVTTGSTTNNNGGNILTGGTQTANPSAQATNIGGNVYVSNKQPLQAPSMSAPSVYGGNCAGFGASLAGSLPGVGVSAGITTPDNFCRMGMFIAPIQDVRLRAAMISRACREWSGLKNDLLSVGLFCPGTEHDFDSSVFMCLRIYEPLGIYQRVADEECRPPPQTVIAFSPPRENIRRRQ